MMMNSTSNGWNLYNVDLHCLVNLSHGNNSPVHQVAPLSAVEMGITPLNGVILDYVSVTTL
jgi:hypothetical protein